MVPDAEGDDEVEGGVRVVQGGCVGAFDTHSRLESRQAHARPMDHLVVVVGGGQTPARKPDQQLFGVEPGAAAQLEDVTSLGEGAGPQDPGEHGVLRDDAPCAALQRPLLEVLHLHRRRSR